MCSYPRPGLLRPLPMGLPQVPLPGQSKARPHPSPTLFSLWSVSLFVACLPTRMSSPNSPDWRLSYLPNTMSDLQRTSGVCRVSEWVNECSSQLPCQVELGPFLLGSAPNPQSGRRCVPPRNSLRNPGQRAWRLNPLQNIFIAKEGSQEKRGGGSSEGQNNIQRLYALR